MSYELTLNPAYRDYKTSKECYDAWNAGKDFIIETVMSPYCGKYTSIRDSGQFPGKCVKIRFNKMTRFILINLATNGYQIDDPSL